MVAIVVVSLEGVPIRLTEERWRHILEYHDELARFLDNMIIIAIAEPDGVFESPSGVEKNLVAIKRFKELARYGLADYLAVHYKEVSSEDGFILTVFPISVRKLQKRYKLWRRLK